MDASKFRDNLKAAIDAHREKTGEKLSRFSERVLGPGDAKYKWLRKICSEGSPYKREGTKNHKDLQKLHAEFGIPWPGLWEPQPIEDDLIDRLRRLLGSEIGGQVRTTLTQVLDKLEASQSTNHPTEPRTALVESVPPVALSPNAKMLAAFQCHPEWSRYVQHVGTEETAIARAEESIRAKDRLLAGVKPTYPAERANEWLLNELSKQSD